MDRGLIRLELDRDHAGDRLACKRTPGQRCLDQTHDLLGFDPPLAADPERQDLRVQHQAMGRSRLVPVGHQQRAGTARTEPGAARGQPVGGTRLQAERHVLARQQGAGHNLGGGWIARRPTGRRPVERQAEAEVARGRDRSLAALRPGDRQRQLVGPPMTAEQRHGEAAVVGQRHDRRPGPLVAEQGRQDPDQDAGRADADDRARARVEVAKQGREVVIGLEVGSPVRARPVQRAAGQRGLAPARRLEAAPAEQDDRRASAHAAVPPGSRMSAK